MNNINDLYKEAGIKPGKQTPLNTVQGIQSPIKTSPGKKGSAKVLGIVTALVIIGAAANLIANKNFLDFGSGFKFKVLYVVVPIFLLNFLIRFIVKLVKKNKNVESYKEQS